MLKRLLGLVLTIAIAFGGVAHAQSANAPSTGGTQTTRPAMPPMPMMGMMGSDRNPNSPVTAGELASIGVGVVVGAVVFQGAMWHGMTIVGAALGGWAADYIYNWHTNEKSGGA